LNQTTKPGNIPTRESGGDFVHIISGAPVFLPTVGGCLSACAASVSLIYCNQKGGGFRGGEPYHITPGGFLCGVESTAADVNNRFPGHNVNRFRHAVNRWGFSAVYAGLSAGESLFHNVNLRLSFLCWFLSLYDYKVAQKR
jgi:hypothetical protein